MNSISLPDDCAKQWELILLLLSSEEKRIDKSCEDEMEIITNLYRNEGVRKILSQWLWQMRSTANMSKTDKETPTKCDNLALVWRQKGNEFFKLNQLEKSYDCYTKSVLFAKRGGTMYPLALANRSATLLHMKRYKHCLMDIKLALANGYPEEQIHKLYLREVDCHIELNHLVNASVALEMAKKYADKSLQSAGNISEFARNVDILEKKIQMAELTYEHSMPVDVVLPGYFMGENENFVNASSALNLRCNEHLGRHVTASENIQRGNVLFVEKPYAFVALPMDDNILPIACEYCCQSDINLVPCTVCSRSIYCSDECRQEGWETFHKWECIGSQSKIWPTIGIAHLAIRVLLLSTNSGFPTTKNTNRCSVLTAHDLYRYYSQQDNIDIYKSTDQAFFRVYNLVTNFDKMNSSDFVQYALTAIMLTLYLELYTTYFKYLPSRLPVTMSDTEMKLFVASMLLRNMGQLVCNGHAITGLREVMLDGGISTEKEVRFATAIYSSASMMNHSCDPNIINSFYKSFLIVKANRNIDKGNEVFNCYGPQYTREVCKDRRVQLKAQYLFDCMCSACIDPDKRDFILLFTAYSCPKCKGPVLLINKKPTCKQCKTTELKIDKTQAMVSQSDELMKQSEIARSTEERCDKLLAALRLKQQCLHRHHVAIRENVDRLACVYAELGEYTKSIEMIKQCIPILEYQFGSFSVEVAHELKKLADVMLMRVLSSMEDNKTPPSEFRDWCMETHKIIKKGLQLFDLNFGPWDASYKYLLEKDCVIRSVFVQSDSSSENSGEHSIHNLVHYNLKI